MKNLFCIILLQCLFMSELAIANPLAGINKVGILIEELPNAAKSCNISEDFIDASLRIPLSNSKLKISDEILLAPYLYVNITAIDDGLFCILYIQTSYSKWVTEEKKSGIFWNKGELVSIKKINIRNVTAEIIESHAKQFISAWLKANPS